jgi:CRISPR-associated protein Cas1
VNIYVTTQGARIIREGRHLLVKKGEHTYHTLFVEKLKQVMLFGSITISPAARAMLLKHQVDTIFFRKDGRYVGRYATPEPKNIMLRRRQFTLLDNPEFGLTFCRTVVLGKLTSMTSLLMRISRTKKHKEPRTKAKQIRALYPAIAQAKSVESLRGYEGRGSAAYFGVLRWGLNDNFDFNRRVRRPPTDPVNAVLSLLYTFLFNRVYAAIRTANLDPYPAFLHVPDYGRFSLVMDLMEEFRVIVVDTLVLSLFNLKILQHDDFITEEPPPLSEENQAPTPDVTGDPFGLMSGINAGELFDVPPQRMADTVVEHELEAGRGKWPVKLKPSAFGRVIENFERKLTTEFHYLPEDRKITYNEALTAQAGQYRKLVEGATATYEPLTLR